VRLSDTDHYQLTTDQVLFDFMDQSSPSGLQTLQVVLSFLDEAADLARIIKTVVLSATDFNFRKNSHWFFQAAPT
jgi:hypothetical protein